MNISEQGSLLKIYYCRYLPNISRWEQKNIMTPYWRFYWNPTPGAAILSNGKRIELVPEQFYIIPGYHCFSSTSKVAFSQFYIHFQLLLTKNNHQYGVFSFPAGKRKLAFIRQFCEVDESSIPIRQFRLLTALAVLSPVLMQLPEDIWQLKEDGDPRILKAVDYLSHHCDTHCSNEELSLRAGMSRDRFCRLFEQQLGESPQAYSRRKRIEHACELLSFSDLTLDEIAERTGFANRDHFSRVFSQILHIPPATFRKRGRG